MADYGSSARRDPPNPLWIVAAVIAALIVGGLILASCQPSDYAFWKPQAARYACPRPQTWTGVQPGFNQQEQEIRRLRRLGFENDFFAQLELGRRYRAEKATDKNLEDPIEAAVWYAMALANPEGFAPINRSGRGGLFGGPGRPLSKYDDCRAWERHEAYRVLDRLLSRMSTSEQEKVRDRVIYVQSTRGSEGFRTLARLYDDLYGPFGEPADNEQALEARGRFRPNGERGYRAITSLFPRNDVDAYLYNYLAMQTGDVSAYVLLKDFERSSPDRAGYGAFVEAKANRWVPPYEFYPPDSPDSGVPHSDESRPRGDAYEFALSRIRELPFKHVSDALLYLGVIQRPVGSAGNMAQGEIDTFKGMIGEAQRGPFTALDAVRAIQYAAVSGSSRAQLVLAVMYAEGVGVPADYARSFYWFSEADKQGSPEAKFAMSTYFALGVEGVADQDKAEAVVYRMDSALSGFKPTISRIQAVLAQVSRANNAGRGSIGPARPYARRAEYGGGDAYRRRDYGPREGRPPEGRPPEGRQYDDRTDYEGRQ